ncbi:flagellar basal body P-ring protein FlgI [Pseudoalteromonas shioyasakiensis]|uniref:flagellar basal body P-ring protein FlgI n=1 Tax=Pseudoalteromonas shioyasakiensis TaxID=1190813 RepID=UPI00211828C2|nr:flagellar basal body P-ring protein FlgI [Pseudoalteromonas shioyasakiensis]MCQ8877512.1 flagellar basal body P-ring protein FlgI [Pseudoalteromonas shioyasakiensis]
MNRFIVALCVFISCFSAPTLAAKSRPLLDLVDVLGVRENQLVGYGLVVGLAGSGDKAQVKFSAQSLNNMLKQFGVTMDESALPKSKNIAAVAVHATLPAMANPGQAIDVTVNSLGDAKSLHGGSLMLTPLKGVDGKVYALAQGNLVVGGMNASGQNGSSVTVNVPTSGIIPSGAIIERNAADMFKLQANVVLNLKQPNYQTARNIVKAINKVFGPGIASAENWGRLQVSAPADANSRNTFMSMLQDIRVEQGLQQPRVIVNSRTGTVVMNDLVKVNRAAVSHGNLTITIAETEGASQPGAFSNGRTLPLQASMVDVNEQQNHMLLMPEGTSLDEIVKAVNALGATPSELMSILIALDKAGALEAELLVI